MNPHNAYSGYDRAEIQLSDYGIDTLSINRFSYYNPHLNTTAPPMPTGAGWNSTGGSWNQTHSYDYPDHYDYDQGLYGDGEGCAAGGDLACSAGEFCDDRWSMISYCVKCKYLESPFECIHYGNNTETCLESCYPDYSGPIMYNETAEDKFCLIETNEVIPIYTNPNVQAACIPADDDVIDDNATCYTATQDFTLHSVNVDPIDYCKIEDNEYFFGNDQYFCAGKEYKHIQH